MQISMLLHCFLSILLLSLQQVPSFAVHKHYIIYLGSHHAEPRLSASPETITNSHNDLISSVLISDIDQSERIVYSYNKIFNALAANLHEEEANKLAKHPEVISIFESKPVKLLTTRSTDFLLDLGNQPKDVSNIDKSVWEKTSFGDGIIIANLDGGVWPESQSFADEGLGPIPKKFKGKCENEHDPTFKCNRKLIGARYFYKGLAAEAKQEFYTFNHTLSPRDGDGHGTHTLSTAGGNFVPGASFRGFANGTAKGLAPRARLVAYKSSWHPTKDFPFEASAMDVLASFEAAIDDDVDIINLSMGNPTDEEEYVLAADPLVIGSFHAMKNGILTVASAGNSGPKPGTVENTAPWLLTVAASTVDREFSSFVVLDNHQKIKGSRYLDWKTLDPNKTYPLITGSDARIPNAKSSDGLWCKDGTLDVAKVTGKILVCRFTYNNTGAAESERSIAAKKVGAVGLILVDDMGAGIRSSELHMVTTVVISYKDGQTLFAYINSTRSPAATITEGTTSIGIKPSPIMAHFSSRGPNQYNPNILKPDVTAPGLDILAANPPHLKNSPFAIGSGTSMSAPHVSGVAALIKKLHPNWSTAAIKSAIMTTASPFDNNRMIIRENDKESKATPFAYGSGHVRPNLAIDPGLVYDMNHYDYLNFICSLTHNNSTAIQEFSEKQSYKCPPFFNILDFNYPSISIPDFSGNATATRKLKNVGQPSTYVPRIETPPGVSVVVEPKTLVFSLKDQEIKFKLTFTADVKILPNKYIFGNLVWSDGKHIVRSPIAIMVENI